MNQYSVKERVPFYPVIERSLHAIKIKNELV
nr:MAG TPA: hypothetical protein [Caudoviricetes sp.]